MFFILLTLVWVGIGSLEAQQRAKNYPLTSENIENRVKIRSLFRLAGLGEDKAFIQRFKNAGITDINTPVDEHKNTLLMRMICSMKHYQGNKEKIVQFLLEQPTIDLNVASEKGTALITTIREGIPTASLVEKLVSAGARPQVKQKGMNRVDIHDGDGSKSIYGNAYSFIKLYSKFSAERPKSEFYHKAIERGLETYKKRKKIYTGTIHKEIAEQLHGVTDLANICIGYVVIPTLPESVEKQDASSCSTTSLCLIS